MLSWYKKSYATNSSVLEVVGLRRKLFFRVQTHRTKQQISLRVTLDLVRQETLTSNT